ARELLAAGVDPCVPRLALKLAPRVTLGLTLVPPGEFLMGSPEDEAHREADEGPVHRVTISKGFYLGTHPVTRQQWKLLMGTSPGRFSARVTLPVDGVSWLDGMDFCARLNRQLGRRFRLPTEAEWEYACRA